MTDEQLRRRRERALGPAYRLFYREPVTLVRGAGTKLYDADGREYLDAYNNVPSVGHCHPRVVAAQNRQAEILNTHTRYLSEQLVDYAERLLATFPAEVSNVMFTCTGSEAVDLALRVARFHRPGGAVIVSENAYHGATAAAAAISPSLGAAAGADIVVVPAPAAGVEFADGVRDAVGRVRERGQSLAALIVDTIFSSDGVRPDPAGFLRPAVDAVRAAGGLFIADEVQPGFGRTGAGMWGFTRHAVTPDLVVLGKPMGNGMPIAAMLARAELLAELGAQTRYFNTFAGNPVSIAAAGAVLDVIAEEKLIANAADVGGYLREQLRALAARRRMLGEVRGAGLFLGVDIRDDAGAPDPAATADLVEAYRANRVLVGTTGADGAAIKIRPPLPFSRADADRFLQVTETIAAR